MTSALSAAGHAVSRFRILRLTLAAATLAIAAMLSGQGAISATGPAPGMTMMLPQTGVVLQERQVCALLDSTSAAITGQDGGQSLDVGGTSYWIFGDTTLGSSPWLIPNNVATTTDRTGGDCVTLNHKAANGVATPLLPLSGDPDERMVWPLSMASTTPGSVDFFYASMSLASSPFELRFIGQARFDTSTLAAARLGADPTLGESFWPPEYGIGSVSTLTEGGFLYAFLGVQDGWLTSVRLARVPVAQIEDVAAYTYWHADSAQFTTEFAGSTVVIEELLAHPPSQVAWNDALSKWTMVYFSYGRQSVVMRTAAALQGPWSEPAPLFDCRRYYPGPGRLGTYCYAASQHAELQNDGGQTIYVTVANEREYRLVLHEITFAEPIRQVVDANGQRLYLAPDQPTPPGALSEGVAFYAGGAADGTLTAIHRWSSGGEIEYAPKASAPPGFADDGIAFYAPMQPTVQYAPLSPNVSPSTRTMYEPVFQWDAPGVDGGPALHIYSQFPAVPGYQRGAIAFYAPCPDTDQDGLSDCQESAIGTSPTNADSDGDKCTDAGELSIGLSPLDSWDFYSVPVPALSAAPDPLAATADDRISMSDAQAVLSYFKAGAKRGTAVYEQDADQNGVPDGIQYDRSVVGSGESGPPDGAVSARDAQLVFAQFRRHPRC
jgi:hypothetical protein